MSLKADDGDGDGTFEPGEEEFLDSLVASVTSGPNKGQAKAGQIQSSITINSAPVAKEHNQIR